MISCGICLSLSDFTQNDSPTYIHFNETNESIELNLYSLVSKVNSVLRVPVVWILIETFIRDKWETKLGRGGEGSAISDPPLPTQPPPHRSIYGKAGGDWVTKGRRHQYIYEPWKHYTQWRSQPLKTTYCMIPCTWSAQSWQIHRRKVDWWLPEAEGVGVGLWGARAHG